MSKYEKLRTLLMNRENGEWRVSFSELEKLLGVSLPSSAYGYAAWWSNHPFNNSMTKVWLQAGWRTEQVDVPGQYVTFRHFGAPHAGDDYPSRADAGRSVEAGLNESETMFRKHTKSGGEDIFAKLYGCMKGTVKIATGVDLTDPLFTDKDIAAFDEKWDRLLEPSGVGSRKA